MERVIDTLIVTVDGKVREIVTERQDAFIPHIGVITKGLASGLKGRFCTANGKRHCCYVVFM